MPASRTYPVAWLDYLREEEGLGRHNPLFSRLALEILADFYRLGLSSPFCIVDIGGGEGGLLEALLYSGLDVRSYTILDREPKLLEIAKSRASNVPVSAVKLDLEALTGSPNSEVLRRSLEVDLVCMVRILNYLPDSAVAGLQDALAASHARAALLVIPAELDGTEQAEQEIEFHGTTVAQYRRPMSAYAVFLRGAGFTMILEKSIGVEQYSGPTHRLIIAYRNEIAATTN